MSAVRSTAAGAALGAVMIVAAAASGVAVTSGLPAFNADRGWLQLLVAIPLAVFAAGIAIAYTRALDRAQMLWAMLPVALLILIVAGAFGIGYKAWGWVLALDALVFGPWVVGLLIGLAVRARRS